MYLYMYNIYHSTQKSRLFYKKKSSQTFKRNVTARICISMKGWPINVPIQKNCFNQIIKTCWMLLLLLWTQPPHFPPSSYVSPRKSIILTVSRRCWRMQELAASAPRDSWDTDTTSSTEIYTRKNQGCIKFHSHGEGY